MILKLSNYTCKIISELREYGHCKEEGNSSCLKVLIPWCSALTGEHNPLSSVGWLTAWSLESDCLDSSVSLPSLSNLKQIILSCENQGISHLQSRGSNNVNLTQM